MEQPSARNLDDSLQDAARGIAERIHAAGGRAWLVGGAPRDLALGNAPSDIDLATDLLPERIEALFEQTIGVGKAFGTMIVIWGGNNRRGSGQNGDGRDDVSVEVTTFRSEGGYSDGRRPDQVTYGSSVEEDAARRDFTCNALYLDPITDEFRDPEHGLEDLAAGRLRCVGEARARFREDGLRILRLVRFAARLNLVPEEATLSAARTELDSLHNVSSERVRKELEGCLNSPDPEQAFVRLRDIGAHDCVLPGWLDGTAGDRRLAVLGTLGPACGPELGFAALFDPNPDGELDPGGCQDAKTALLRLHPSKEQRNAVTGLWSLQAQLAKVAGGVATRADRVRILRDPLWTDALRLFRARGVGDASALQELERDAREWSPEQLRPTPLLSANDLSSAGVERGPQFGVLLKALEEEQLELRVTDRASAETWLADQLGGNQRRNDHETG